MHFIHYLDKRHMRDTQWPTVVNDFIECNSLLHGKPLDIEKIEITDFSQVIGPVSNAMEKIIDSGDEDHIADYRFYVKKVVPFLKNKHPQFSEDLNAFHDEAMEKLKLTNILI